MTSQLVKLGVSSAQFGLDQAVTARGRPRDVEARDILSIAARSGLGVLEIGRHSTDGEKTLGQITPKPNPFRVTVTTVRPDRGPDFAEAEVRAQIARLGLASVDAILIPSATDLLSPTGPALWDRLRALRDEGLCAKIGVPVYASDDPSASPAASSPTCRPRPACWTSACWPTARCNASPAWASRCSCARSS
jgi:aryl-alcohol dehydrogenase-like predicted oxidoreductase